VAGHKNTGVTEKFIAHDVGKFVHRIDVDERMFPDVGEEIDFFQRIVIPIAAAGIFKPGDFKRARLSSLLCAGNMDNRGL
jgi:hypothetical protein